MPLLTGILYDDLLLLLQRREANGKVLTSANQTGPRQTTFCHFHPHPTIFPEDYTSHDPCFISD